MFLSKSELKQIKLLKKKTPVGRFLMMVELVAAQIEATKAGLKIINPKMNKKELEQCLQERMKKIYSWKH